MLRQLSPDQAFLLGPALEGLTYGFLVCLFCGTVVMSIGGSKKHDRHTVVMVLISSAMFFLETIHFSMHCYRILQGFSVHVNDDGGPVGYLGDLRKWHHILKALLYVTQEVLGNAAATYRCFIIWNRKWRVVAVPVILLMGSTATGYACCGRFAQFQTDPVISIFDARLYSWVLSFYVLAVAQNIITTSLMAYRLWNTSRKTAQFKATENRLLPILRIIVESAALQLLVEILLLALYAQRLNAQHILLELVAAVVGITFNAITLRIRLMAVASSRTTPSEFRLSKIEPIQTIGSAPSRRVKINMVTEVEEEFDTDTSAGVVSHPYVGRQTV
ncbi:hypothetical protein ONZ45_g5513 [Pleurotus djamor]|nr:hypothetical protein ONZ45_g5513 [Pleurotus djamor]